ncbi:proteasome activator pa28 REG alpha beta subunit [Boletus reticuloceps]|uniref:Proteasome activator pa28 REG alpha beta subunit n=1 Tax=Boletus reticuloceps TaxID=495285 RepID=A0A8I2Z1I7_9AGAM|nr:proteasome activator pa28 REG alpha beta subunit [Boletus reticuloceps]
MTMSMPKETSEKLEAFRAGVASVAEDIIFRVFPAKTFELSSIIDGANAPDSPYSVSHAPASTDPRVYPPPNSPDPNGPSSKRKRVEDGIVLLTNDIANAKYPELVHANKHILKLQETIKAECAQLSDSCDKVKLWVNLTMPKCVLNVSSTQQVLSELLRSQESAYNIRDSVRQNYLARAKICSKLIKYPNIEDYTLALKEHDEKQLFFARQNLVDIRNVYAVMTDILHKNMSKIRSPRGNNRAGLY